MRTKSLARRSVAVVATTALISGGLAAGFAAPAFAATATVSKVAPDSWDNRSETTLTLTGTNFSPSDTVILRPACADPIVMEGPACQPLTGPEVGDLEFAADPALPIDDTLTVEVDLSMAAPGYYRVIVHHDIEGTNSSPAPNLFRIFAYGGANAASTVTGIGTSARVPVTGTDCTASDALLGGGCGRLPGLQALDVKGSNFAIGAKVEFLKDADNSVDSGLPFTVGNPSNGQNAQNTSDDTGYPSATLIQGSYETVLKPDLTNSFTPGWHKVRVTNTDGKSGSTALFSQPYFGPAASGAGGALSFPTASNPNPAPSDTIGQGAKNKVLRVTGQGFRAGSTLFVQAKPSSANDCDDLTVGPSTLGGLGADGLYTTISAPLTFADCDTPNNDPRQVGVIGPDGGRFFRSGFLKIGGYPTFTKFQDSQFAVLGQGAHEGFDGAATDGVLVLGSDFVGAGETDPAKMVAFDFGPGVTATTRSVNITGASAFISIDVAPDAGTGERTVRVTNPDGGSAVSDCERLDTGDCDPTGDGPLLEITEGPKVSKIAVAPDSPTASMTPNQASPTKFNVTGSGFQETGYSSDQFIVALPGQTTQDPKIQVTSVQRSSATALTFQASALTGAAPGLRDLIIENDDHGRVVCEGCLGIDSITVSPNTAANTGASPAITLTVIPDGLPAFTASSVVTMTHQTPALGQPTNTGTNATVGGPKQGTRTFDLTNAALGAYNVSIVLDPTAATPTTVSCIGCFTVTGTAFTLDAAAPVTPNDAGQGVKDRLITFKGTNFTKGMTVSIPEVTVHDVIFKSSTEVTALVDVARDAATGEKTGTIKGGDGVSKTFAFTVNLAPSITSSTPAAFGAGAGSPGSPDVPSGSTPATLTVSGAGFDSTAPVSQLVLGTGITAEDEAVTQGEDPTCLPVVGCTGGTADELTGDLSILQNAPLGKRAVTVVNSDGGVGTLADAFTVNPGPKISSIANASGQPVLCRPAAPGCTNPQKITVLGSDFPTPATDGEKAAAFKLLKTDGTPATGVSVSNMTFEAGKITADVTVESGASYGPLRAAVYKASDKGFGTCDTCLFVANVPGAPLSLKLLGGASSLKATWNKPAENGAPITNYHLTIQRSGTSIVIPKDVAPVAGSAQSYTFTGLANDAIYLVKVQAVNAAGAGPFAGASGIPGLVTTLTRTGSTKLVTSGSAMTFSGKLLRGTTPVPNKTITLYFDRSIGTNFTKNVLTSSTGAWSYRYVPTYSFTLYRVAFAGDNVYRKAVVETDLPVAVASRVTRTAPANFSRSSAGSVLKIAGTVSPNKRGKYVYLFRYVNGTRQLVARTTLTSSSTFVFSGTPRRGTYVFRVYIPATTGNAAGYSAQFTLYRV
jgi:hypothetical protein